jgi:hypothetical protein
LTKLATAFLLVYLISFHDLGKFKELVMAYEMEIIKEAEKVFEKM